MARSDQVPPASRPGKRRWSGVTISIRPTITRVTADSTETFIGRCAPVPARGTR